MLPPFDLSVPSDTRYRPLAGEAAAKYAELAGRPADAAKAFGAEVDEATARMARPDENIDVKFVTNEQSVGATLACGDQSATLKTR